MPPDVDQVSRPYLVALAATALLAVAWLTVLHPRTSTGETPRVPPAAPGTAGLAHAVADAKGAVRASEASARRAQAAAGASPATTAAGHRRPATTRQATPAARRAAGAPARVHRRGAAARATSAPARAHRRGAATGVTSAPVDRSAPILRELARGHAVVLLFTARGADDRAARAAARAANAHRGRVDVHVARISQVGDYAAITTRVQVLQAPTTLVIAPSGRTRSIVGLTSSREIDQAIGAALT